MELRVELNNLLKDEELFWAQRAKANWLSLGDRNTKFFQTQVNLRKKQNSITGIKDENGNWLEEANIYIPFIVNDFKKRFSSDSEPSSLELERFLGTISPCIDAIDNELLTAQVNDEEILEAVKSIGHLKAPGPDGLHAIFYQKHWEEVKQKATINWDANVSNFIAGNSWDKEKLLQILDWEIVKQIMGIPIPINNQNDRCVWGPAANACGTIIRNSEGVPIITSSKNIGKASVPTTEATTLRDSILIAKNKGLTRIIVEGDSKIIIDAVNGKISTPWRLQQIIEDIKNLAQEFQEISFNHIYREANFAADATASLGHSITGRRDWFQPLPRSIGRMILFDQIGEGYPRGSFL
ncbi:hypothetical protein ACLB2K_001647 [Fragaria x ananassa]